MRPNRFSLALAAALVAVSASISHFKFLPVQAQSSSAVSGSPPPPGMTPPAMPQSASAGLWRVDRNFQASIHIKNLMTANAVEVTPVLYMADGTEYDLAPINLAPTAVANVGINQALREAPAYVVSHLSTYGSAALKYAYQAPGVVGGQLMMVDAPRSLVFTNGFAMMGAMAGAMPATQTQEAVWWKHDPGVGGFLSLTNTTTASVGVGVRVVGARGLRLPQEFITLAPHAARMLDLAVLTGGLPGLENQEGGIRIQYEGMMADVIAVGGVENDSEGYSADVPIWPHNSASPGDEEGDSPSQAGQAGAAAPSENLIAMFYFPDGSGQYQVPVHLEARKRHLFVLLHYVRRRDQYSGLPHPELRVAHWDGAIVRDRVLEQRHLSGRHHTGELEQGQGVPRHGEQHHQQGLGYGRRGGLHFDQRADDGHRG